MIANEDFFNQLIKSQQQAIRYYFIFAAGLAILGMAVIAFAMLFSGLLIPDIFKGFLGIGGGFVSSLGALQIKEILNCKEKAQIFETLKARRAALEQARETADATERKQIDDLLWKVVEKTALG